MLLLTQGDPASISPEITIASWQALRRKGPVFIYVADPVLIKGVIPYRLVHPHMTLSDIENIFPHALPIIPLSCSLPPHVGQPTPTNSPSVLESIRLCTKLALGSDDYAVVTNPISKITLQKAGFEHPGHTSWLAQLCGCPGEEVMAMVTPQLRTVPLTVHVPLRDALNQLTQARLIKTCRILHYEMQRSFGLSHPKIVCAGLNPHAGEDGMLGCEEQNIIIPALQKLRAEQILVNGPYPADTLFTQQMRASYDIALCMYHDQALIPVKTLDMHHGVNVTLGLPITRTSPDHGTAFDIAGQGKADPRSLLAALCLAAEIQANRRGNNVTS